ncbi:transposase family protein [Streptomyces sp. NPDC056480]
MCADRFLALVRLRHGATHNVLAWWFSVGRSTCRPRRPADIGVDDVRGQ